MAQLLLSLGTHIRLSAEDKLIPARGMAVIDTQISIAVPLGTYGRVAPRSGLGEYPPAREVLFASLTGNGPQASKFGIDTGAGVVDADYRGILYILLFNLGDEEFKGLFPGHACDFFEFFTFFFSPSHPG